MSQKVHIVIEDGRLEILVNDGDPVVVQAAPQEPSETSGPDSEKPAGTSPPEPFLVRVEHPLAPTYQPETPVDDRVKKAVDLGVAIAEHVATNGGVPVDDTQHLPPHVNGGGNISSRPMPADKVISPAPTKRYCDICGDDISNLHFKRKLCLKPECKKAKVKAANEKSRRARGATVGGGSKPSQPVSLGKQFERNDAKPRLADTAPPAQTYLRSKCCEAKTEADENLLSGHRCLACMNECVTYEYTPPFQDLWDCAACREAGRFCRLHAAMDAEGRKPIMGRPPET